MYLPDHNPPHFHVRYNEYHATIDIMTGTVIGFYASPCVEMCLRVA